MKFEPRHPREDGSEGFVGIKDDVVVTEDGYRSLTNARKEFREIGV